MTMSEWISTWRDAHDVSAATWQKYNSYLRNHIEPAFGDMALGDIKRITVKSWVKRLRRHLSDATVSGIVNLLSTILSEAVDDELLTTNPCRRLGLSLDPAQRREITTPARLLHIAHRCGRYQPMIITAAYTGLRWGELAGLQWHNVALDRSPYATITVDPDIGALHEIAGGLQLGPPKTPASARTVHLPPFLAALLREHAADQPHAFVFTGPRGGLLRRSNFSRRVWHPAVAGDTTRGWAPLQPELDFHGLRHTHKSWLDEDRVHQVLQHARLGHRMPGVRGIYSHVTDPMTDHMITQLQHRWHRSHPDPNTTRLTAVA
ncbi:tyrosine-type recombinase/integrase [Saccharopolyspora rosea]|uniref:tyrosine-type recombinase/integrase n=1 Tax=Saccharopolyspora rosea TaxID=524884 RepID=UPI0021D94F64|nr:site-specific integrase [Saccharopolyspora rosea]